MSKAAIDVGVISVYNRCQLQQTRWLEDVGLVKLSNKEGGSVTYLRAEEDGPRHSAAEPRDVSPIWV